jgi:hypothetical protein
MIPLIAFLGLFGSGASAIPLDISLPPLIPSIPGVTAPLASNAPPLPVLQIPTPPIDSPPHEVNESIRPKKIGYFWTGAGDNIHKDFLAAYSLDDVNTYKTSKAYRIMLNGFRTLLEL